MTIPKASRCFHINGVIFINLIPCADSHPWHRHVRLTSVCSWGKPRFPPNPFPLGGTVASRPNEKNAARIASLYDLPPSCWMKLITLEAVVSGCSKGRRCAAPGTLISVARSPNSFLSSSPFSGGAI